MDYPKFIVTNQKEKSISKQTVNCNIDKRPEFFYYLIYKPSYCNFPESRKKSKKIISKIIFLFYLPTLFIVKKYIIEVLPVYFWEWLSYPDF